jgi:hypothetical protein
MEQQQKALLQQQQPQHPDSTTKHAAAQAGLHLARLAGTAGLLLQVWLQCMFDTSDQLRQSKLKAVTTSVAYSADVATGIAAIWRSKGVLQQWHAASGDTAAGVSFTTALAAAAFADRAAPAAGRSAQQSARLLSEHRVEERAAREVLSPVSSSQYAARKVVLQLSLFMQQADAWDGCGAAHDLQWVMLVYAALLVGRLHQQQGGISPVQLHTTQPTTHPIGSSSSSQRGPPGSSSNSSTASTSSAGSSNKGRSKKGSSKKASRAQQASSSAAAASPPVKGSLVPPHHLQVLRTAGLAFGDLKFEVLDCPHTDMLTAVIGWAQRALPIASIPDLLGTEDTPVQSSHVSML